MAGETDSLGKLEKASHRCSVSFKNFQSLVLTVKINSN